MATKHGAPFAHGPQTDVRMFHHPLVSLQSLSVTFLRHADSRPVASVALDAIHWNLYPGEHWAIIGHNGAGKSTLLRVIRGEQRPCQKHHGASGTTHNGGADARSPVIWYIDGERQTTPFTIRRRIATVTSEMQEHYVRQQWRLTGEEVLHTGFFDSPLLYEQVTPQQREDAYQLARMLDVQHLLDMELPAMSQGQLRKLLVARAMVATPAILVLDEVCEGLDARSRSEVLSTIDRAAALGTSILFASHRLDELPACITHGMLLNKGRIALQGIIETVVSGHENAADAPELPDADTMPPLVFPPSMDDDTPLVSINAATVYINRKPVLHDLTWQIRPGENWVVRGGNGAGKSTLLRLLLGDERQAWGGTIHWFGDSTPDIQQLRRRIGYVSDRFQATYGHDRYHGTLMDISGEELVLTGFTASVGLWDWQQATDQQRATARDWMRYMGIADYGTQRIRDMSYGRLRRFMLCRAVAPGPQLLLLDEPCSGLDPAARAHFLMTLRTLVQHGMQIVYVTHYGEELIPEIIHSLTLEAGRITAIGPRSQGEQ